jgi:hypothetical protein
MAPIELHVDYRGIPHLAKNERDVGHPIFCCRYRRPVISLPTPLSESAARDDKKERVVAGKRRSLRRGRLLKERAPSYPNNRLLL